MTAARERGSSVVEFVLLTALLGTLLFAVLQVAFYFYARNVIAASAADAARFAAASGMDPATGAARANELVDHEMHGAAAQVRCAASGDVDTASGLRTLTVRCAGRLDSVFLPLGRWLHVDVRASALREAPS